MSIFGDMIDKIFSSSGGDRMPAGGGVLMTPPEAGRVSETTSAPTLNPVSHPKDLLQKMASENKQKLNWDSSIVDLLKLLNMDSSLSARTRLADELGYKGDKSDSAAMNTWLHKTVMEKFAENGGAIPESMKH